MDVTMPSTTDDDFNLDVRFVESDLEIAGGDTDDCTKECTDDECTDTREGCE
jgi:hypothetical protein